jgi:hypothetical protein
MACARITIHRQGGNPFCSTIEPTEIIRSHHHCEVCMVWRRWFHQLVRWFYGGCVGAGVTVGVPCIAVATLIAL